MSEPTEETTLDALLDMIETGQLDRPLNRLHAVIHARAKSPAYLRKSLLWRKEQEERDNAGDQSGAAPRARESLACPECGGSVLRAVRHTPECSRFEGPIPVTEPRHESVDRADT